MKEREEGNREEKKEVEEKEDPIREAEKKEKEQNKTLKNIFIVFGIFMAIIILGVIFINSARNWEYRGITGNVIKEGDIIFWQTSLPVIHKGEEVPYNFYLRNDPRKLDYIVFDGELVLLRNMVINSTEDFNCDGKGIISIINLQNLYNVIGTKVIKDENATCDEQGKYMFLQIQGADKTSIEQVGPACYNLNVNNCEILEVTERFMYETLIEVDNYLKNETDDSLF